MQLSLSPSYSLGPRRPGLQTEGSCSSAPYSQPGTTREARQSLMLGSSCTVPDRSLLGTV